MRDLAVDCIQFVAMVTFIVGISMLLTGTV